MVNKLNSTVTGPGKGKVKTKKGPTVFPPIYTDDKHKIQMYQDSLKLSKATDLQWKLLGWPEQQSKPSVWRNNSPRMDFNPKKRISADLALSTEAQGQANENKWKKENPSPYNFPGNNQKEKENAYGDAWYKVAHQLDNVWGNSKTELSSYPEAIKYIKNNSIFDKTDKAKEIKLIDGYKKLGFTDKNIAYWGGSTDVTLPGMEASHIWSDKDWGLNPYYPAPKQPYYPLSEQPQQVQSQPQQALQNTFTQTSVPSPYPKVGGQYRIVNGKHVPISQDEYNTRKESGTIINEWTKKRPGYQNTGTPAQLGKLDPKQQAINDQYFTTPQSGMSSRSAGTGFNNTISGLVGVAGDQIQKAADVAAGIATGGASTMVTGASSKAAMGMPSPGNAPTPTIQGTTANPNSAGTSAFGTKGIVPKAPSMGQSVWEMNKNTTVPPTRGDTPLEPLPAQGISGRSVKHYEPDGYDEFEDWKNSGFNSTDQTKMGVPQATTNDHINKPSTAKMDWSKGMTQGAIGLGVAGIQYGLAKAADDMQPNLDVNLMRPGQNNMWKNVQAAQTGGNIRQRKYSFQGSGDVNSENIGQGKTYYNTNPSASQVGYQNAGNLPKYYTNDARRVQLNQDSSFYYDKVIAMINNQKASGNIYRPDLYNKPQDSNTASEFAVHQHNFGPDLRARGLYTWEGAPSSGYSYFHYPDNTNLKPKTKMIYSPSGMSIKGTPKVSPPRRNVSAVKPLPTLPVDGLYFDTNLAPSKVPIYSMQVKGQPVGISEQRYNNMINNATSTQVIKQGKREGYQLGGNPTSKMINNTGYTPGYESYNNPYNIIPSNNITMQNTPFPIHATADTGEKRVLYPGQNYKFAGAKRVLEVPMA